MRISGLLLTAVFATTAAGAQQPPVSQAAKAAVLKGPKKLSKAAKAAAHKGARGARPAVATAVPQPTPEQPVVQVPLRPSQLPPVPPRISYHNGQLTVVAENTSMADIFGAIRLATGTNIETTGAASGDRVAAKIGPASIREVLLSLLQGSRYDYVILGSVADSNRIERVILTPKATGGQETASSAGPLRPQQPYEPPDDQEIPPEEGEEEEGGGFIPVRGPGPAQPGIPDQNQQPQPGQPVPTPQQPGQPGASDQPKTPEQLLEELRRLELQRQQQTPLPAQRPDHAPMEPQQQDPNRPR